jgi:K+-transporting ATPase ATPase A chain
MLYYYSSTTGNNGSAFAGLTTNTPWYNTMGGCCMLIGRFFMMIPVIGLAGSLVQKKIVPQSAGSFPVTGVTFVVLVISTILIVGALTFFPALAMSPIVEHFLMHGSSVTY